MVASTTVIVPNAQEPDMTRRKLYGADLGRAAIGVQAEFDRAVARATARYKKTLVGAQVERDRALAKAQAKYGRAYAILAALAGREPEI
jgi:hypothetical protein